MKVVLLGELGAHARGKTLAAAIGAVAGALPQHGVAMAFGKDAQQKVDELGTWAEWAQQPGRVLMLLPPFQRGECGIPTTWEARRADAVAGGETELGRLLARERQHELRGDLMPAERVGGQVVTGSWRRHPTAGLFVVTALPIWSLLVLDHQPALRAWLDDFLRDAGTPREAAMPGPAADFRPAPHDWTVLLQLCAGPYEDGTAALTALAASRVFRIDAAEAAAALGRLQAAGWAQDGTITEAGRAALRAGPYRDHARAIERRRHV